MLLHGPPPGAPLPPMARLAGLEPATTGLEGRCSIRLSYRRIDWLVRESGGPLAQWSG